MGSQTAVCLEATAGVWRQGEGRRSGVSLFNHWWRCPYWNMLIVIVTAPGIMVEWPEATALCKNTREMLFSCDSAPAAVGPINRGPFKSLSDPLTLVWEIDGLLSAFDTYPREALHYSPFEYLARAACHIFCMHRSVCLRLATFVNLKLLIS